MIAYLPRMLRRSLVLAITLALAGSALADEPAPPPAPALPEAMTGPVPGATGYSIDDKADDTYCGGHKLTLHAPKKRPKDVDAEMDAMLRITAPTGLDFTAEHADATRKKLDKWFTAAVTTAMAAQSLYEKRATDDKATDAARVEAIARLAIVHHRFADVLARMPIPASVRRMPEAVTAYCDTLAEKAQPLWQKAYEAAGVCAKKAADARLAPGWWAPVCVEQPAAPAKAQ